MTQHLRLSLLDLVLRISDALDLVSPELVNHHKRTAYVALGLAQEHGLTRVQQTDVVLASLLHDAGVISQSDVLANLDFELSMENQYPVNHAELGHFLLKGHELFDGLANIIRHHHIHWAARGKFPVGEVPKESYVVHLADRVDVALQVCESGPESERGALKEISTRAGTMFDPALVSSLESLAEREYFWFDLRQSAIGSILRRDLLDRTVDLELDQLESLGDLFARLIDFRSSFTATHSSGVAASAVALARLCGFCDAECRVMQIAGYLHDLGKLAVPREVLEKKGPLTPDEFALMKSHTYHGYRILERIPGFETINEWASLHHERLDGTGYPFRRPGGELPLGSRIMAVADVFTAITEDRPYRAGMSVEDTLKVLGQMAENRSLDARIVGVLAGHFNEVNKARMQAQSDAGMKYLLFGESTGQFSAPPD